MSREQQNVSFRRARILFWHKIVVLLSVTVVTLTLGIALMSWRALHRASGAIGDESSDILSGQSEASLRSLVRERAAALDVQLTQALAAASYGALFMSESAESQRNEGSWAVGLLPKLHERTVHCTAVYCATSSGVVVQYPPAAPVGAPSSDFSIADKPFLPRIADLGAGEAAWSEVHVNPLSATFDLVVDAVAPVVESGQTRGYVGVSVSLTRMVAQFNQYQPVRGSYSFLVDGEWRLVGAPPHGRVELSSPEAFRPKGVIALDETGNPELDSALQGMVLGESALRAVRIRDELKYLAYHPLRSIDWRLGIVVPVRMATAASERLVGVVDTGIRQVLTGITFWAAGFLALALLAGVVFARHLTDPVRRLSAFTESIAAGDYGQRAAISSRDEMGDLAEAFNSMADRIRATVADLGRVNKELRFVNALLTTEQETALEGILVVDEKGDMLQFNRRFVEMWGIPEEVAASKSDERAQESVLSKLIDPDGFRARIKHLYAHPDEKSWDQIALVDGRLLERYSAPMYGDEGQHYGRVWYFRDITEQRNAMDALEKEMEFTTKLIQSTPAFFVAMSAEDDRTLMMNDVMLDALGYTREEVLGAPYSKTFVPEEEWPHMNEITIALSDTANTTLNENHVLTKDGRALLVEWRGRAVADAEGRPDFFFGMGIDVTEKRRAEEELRQLRNLLSNIVNSMPSVLVGVDVESCVTQWNRLAEEATGTAAEEALGRPLAEVFPLLTEEGDRVRRALRTREVQRGLRIPRGKGGDTRYEDVTVYPLVTDGIEGAVIRVDDATERVRMEEMMIQSEKMLSVGGLAAGMAHELNNPLAGILQSTQVVRSRLGESHARNRAIAEECGTTIEAVADFMRRRDVFELLDALMESGRRAARIVANMLSFSRKSEHRPVPCDLAALLDSTVELASSDYDLKKSYDFRHIRIIREYEPDLPAVPCEPTKIQQVFLNILKNGAQAMCQERAHAPEGEPCFVLRIRAEQAMVRVEIEDNGPGMEETTRRRVLEPFFTTKEPGVGTGLGLSVSYFIIAENHGGQMSVESLPGQGANFIIRLPLEDPLV